MKSILRVVFNVFGRGVTVKTATCGARARASLDTDWRMKFEKPAKCFQKAKTRYGAFEKRRKQKTV